MTVLVNWPWPCETETYNSAQAQTQHLQLHHAKHAQSISAQSQQDCHAFPQCSPELPVLAGRTPCSFHAGWQKLTPLEAIAIRLSPDLCKWGCTKTRTLLLSHSYLWQDSHLHVIELCFTTAIKNQHVPPILPGCSSSTLGAGAAMECALGSFWHLSQGEKHTSCPQPLAVVVCAKQRADTTSCICKPQSMQS